MNSPRELAKALATQEGKKGIYSIFLTATVLTIFEIVFFYKIVAPGIDSQMKKGIRDVSQVVANKVKGAVDSVEDHRFGKFLEPLMMILPRGIFNEKTNAVMKTTYERERQLTDKINQYTMFTGGLIVSVLVLFVLAMRFNIKSHVEKDITTGIATKTAIMTVAVLIMFQITFYFFGKRFKYPGSMGQEELVDVMLKSLKVDDPAPEKKE